LAKRRERREEAQKGLTEAEEAGEDKLIHTVILVQVRKN